MANGLLCPVQIVQDVRYFQRIKWQYLVLDEAQAIKSSARWEMRWSCGLAVLAQMSCITGVLKFV